MKKKVIGLTVAGMLALPLVMGGGSANAATPQYAKECKQDFTNLLNPWKLKDQQGIDINEVLKNLGIKLDVSKIQEQVAKQPEAKAPVKAPEEATQPAQPQKSNQPAQPEKPAANNDTKNTENQSSNSEMNAFEQKVVDLTNQERTKAGLKPLKADNSTLSKMARAKSQDMADKNYFDHQSPTYGSPFDMMKKYGITYKSAGENIAAGQKTPEEVVNGWMNSPGHRANILNASFTTIGVGYVKGGSYGSYWTQEFIGN